MKNQLTQLFAEIVTKLGAGDAEIQFDFPENLGHGEYTTNVAMQISKRLKAPPREIAQKIVDYIKTKQKTSRVTGVDHVEIAGPGFINIYLTPGYFGTVLEKVLEEKESFGITKREHKTGENAASDALVGIRDYDEGGHGKTHAKTAPNNVDKKGKTLQHAADNAGKESKNASRALRGKKAEAPEEKGQKIMVEFAHPNTHKAFHIGHLRNITTGESIVRLLESQGNRVIRANYQGDVGMHIAKALYALLEVSPFKDDVYAVKGVNNRVEFLGKAYAAGSKAFEEDEAAQGVIKDLNALIYASAQRYAHEVGRNPGTTDYLALVKNHVHPVETVYALWKETRQWSLDYFETIYARVSSRFDRKYFESECLSGVDTAKDAVKKGVLELSDGAIIFRGEPYGLDTRVFVNSLGLPTYEAKELALAPMEASEFGKLVRIIHCVGPEQASFFKVTFKAEELLGFLEPGVQHHLAYGWVKLKHGKMSSRTGNVVLGEWLIDAVKNAIKDIIVSNSLKQIDSVKKDTSRPAPGGDEDVAEALAIGAIKYAFLKVSTGQEIAFDLNESINTNGDSGPYLMYAYARAKSVLRKAGDNGMKHADLGLKNAQGSDPSTVCFNAEEHALVRLISQFPDIVTAAAVQYAPNAVCTHLFQLAQSFNLFYARHPIADNPLRVAITAATAQVLKNGLYLLGINTLEKM